MKNRTSRLNRLLIVCCAVLLGGQLLYMLVGFASIPRYYRHVTTGTVEPVAYYGIATYSNELVAQSAASRGFSLGQYAIYRIIMNALSAVMTLAVALVLVWRARRRWFVWFTAFIIAFLGASTLSEQTLLGQSLSLIAVGANDIFWPLVLLYLLLFPNGRAVPRRAGWLVGALLIYHFFLQTGTVIAYANPELALRLRMPNWGQGPYTIPVIVGFFIILASQVYRYRHVSSTIERLQTKWFLFGLGLIVALIPVSVFLDATGRTGIANDIADFLFWMPLYFGLAISVLRYRLYDLDVIIRKTLVYGLLTAVLGLVYSGAVVLLQRLLESLSGRQSPVAIVISTLAIAALFSPLRRRIQSFIDRRFFRQKYDAQQVLAHFAQTARDEVSLEALTAELTGAVQQTMQPSAVGVWLREEPGP